MKMRHVIGPVWMAGLVFGLGSVDALAAGPMVAASPACMTVATAKYDQWRQPRLRIDRSRTFANGATRTDEVILTDNTAYRLGEGSWTSSTISLRVRAVASPERILRDMSLAECTKGQSVAVAGEPATEYDLSYLPDAYGNSVHSTVWISDKTGLPLREELVDQTPANAGVAKLMSATYRYNSDVKVPAGAELAESTRLFNNASVVRNFQSGGEGAQQ